MMNGKRTQPATTGQSRNWGFDPTYANLTEFIADIDRRQALIDDDPNLFGGDQETRTWLTTQNNAMKQEALLERSKLIGRG